VASPQTANRPLDWDLSDLYSHFRDPKFSQDLSAAQEQALAFRQRYRGQLPLLSAAEIAAAIGELEGIYERIQRVTAFPSLKFAADTHDREAKRYDDQAQEALADIEQALVFFRLELQGLEDVLFADLQQAPELDPYRYFLQKLAQQRQHQLPEAVEQVLTQAALTGREAFVKLRSLHLGLQSYSAVTLPEGSQAQTESELNALLYHPKPKVRLAAYQSVRHVLETHNPLYGYILNSVVQDHRLDSQRRGYDSTLHKQLTVDEVSMPVFEALMEGTRDRFDLFQRYYRLKGRTMGRSVRICDLYAPWQGSQPRIPYDEGIQTLMQALQAFSPEYADLARPFFEQNWIDARIRPGKRGGAFCAYVPGLHSYLLLSYTDTANALFTLAHEMGHGLHYERIRAHQSYVNSDPPMVLAEIASTFNELLLLDYLLKENRDPNVARSLLTQQLEDQLNLLFRQSTISRLEMVLHQQARQGSFDHEFINEEWLKVYQDLCGDAVELLPEHQFDWARIGHIFFKPFYCYNYSLSFVVSIACYQRYLQEGKDFVAPYLSLLDQGGSQPPEIALKAVGIDLTDPGTIAAALDYTETLIDQLENTLAD
jgi:oligoendopeptidase F